MKKTLRVLLLILLCALICLPTTVAANYEAAAPEATVIQAVYVNPLYKTELPLESIYFYAADTPIAYSNEVFTDIDSLSVYIRAGMVARSDVTFTYICDSDDIYGEIKSAVEKAQTHTGVPREGDYLRSNYLGYMLSGTALGNEYSITLYMYYAANADQERIVDAEIVKLLSSLNLYGKSDYEKVKAVHGWMCENITYDDEHVNDDEYTLQFSAYAALINHTAVCQGYAGLFYRLMLELGVDCRFISGIGNGGPHAWNIVKLGGLYYNVDTTWDAQYYGLEGFDGDYPYFLRCNSNFRNHTRDSVFATSAFNAAYPMGSTDFKVDSHKHVASGELSGYIEPTCTQPGYSGDTLCSVCNEIIEKGKATPAKGHTPASEKINVKESTCAEEGYTGDTLCSVCDEIIEKGEAIPTKEHTPVSEKINVKEATCAEEGYTGDTLCSVCNEIIEKGEATPKKEHTPVSEKINVKEATCAEMGYTGDTLCSVCSEVAEKGENIPALGHHYVDDVCTRCNEPKPDFIPGDLNGDGLVNITDAIELLKYVAKLKNNVVNEAGTDIDGNGTVNINDAIALLKQIAGLK